MPLKREDVVKAISEIERYKTLFESSLLLDQTYVYTCDLIPNRAGHPPPTIQIQRAQIQSYPNSYYATKVASNTPQISGPRGKDPISSICSEKEGDFKYFPRCRDIQHA
jgi:hypothetical protein